MKHECRVYIDDLIALNYRLQCSENFVVPGGRAGSFQVLLLPASRTALSATLVLSCWFGFHNATDGSYSLLAQLQCFHAILRKLKELDV